MSHVYPMFATPEEAENAFYQAIAHGDLLAMMNVWSDDEDILCIQPTGHRLQGTTAVRESWDSIFKKSPRIVIQINRSLRWTGMVIAVHNVFETVVVEDKQKQQELVLATNIFQRGARGWKMYSHHASIAAERNLIAQSEVGTDSVPRVLH
ncbi:MAG: nuclear transport factor 2 family protein [Pseudomonadota bacterium]